jgi:hypothetical protein
VATHHEALRTASLEEEAVVVHEEECAALRLRAGRVDEAVLCVVDPVEWDQVPWDEELLPQDTTTSIRVLTVRALRHASSRLTVRVTGACLLSLLCQLDRLLRWTRVLELRQ